MQVPRCMTNDTPLLSTPAAIPAPKTLIGLHYRRNFHESQENLATCCSLLFVCGCFEKRQILKEEIPNDFKTYSFFLFFFILCRCVFLSLASIKILHRVLRICCSPTDLISEFNYYTCCCVWILHSSLFIIIYIMMKESLSVWGQCFGQLILLFLSGIWLGI